MDEKLLLVPVFVPMLISSGMLFIKAKDSKRKNILIEGIVVLFTVFVWIMSFNTPSSSITLLQITGDFSLKLKMDGFSKVFSLMSSSLWVFVTIYAFEYMKHDERQNTFFAFFIMAFGVTQGICYAANLMTLYVFYEMFTLTTLPLVIHYNDAESRYAGRKYAVYSIGGSAFAFVGIIILSCFFPSTEFVAGGFVTASESDTAFLSAVFLMMFFGFGVKAAIFPFSGWLPAAGVAPTPVTALLHAVAVVKAGIFAIVRLTYYSFGQDFLTGTFAQYTALAFAIFTMLYGAIKALKENHFKRRLAYSTVSNLSYIITALMLLTEEGFIAGLTHMVFHGIIKITAFMCAGSFMHQTGFSYIFEIDGIGKKMPVTFGCYTISALSLMGIPLFCGFISKYLLVNAAVKCGIHGTVAAIALVITSLICAAYMLGITLHAFFPKNGRALYEKSDVREANLTMLIPICVFTAVNIFFGLNPSAVVNFITTVARTIF
ncbi:MAG: proton-conducting membrane transporter [Eubacteriaceae bacterium]|nr:proton-conducting membrane transporter [Eubacteriaceae bacterium]